VKVGLLTPCLFLLTIGCTTDLTAPGNATITCSKSRQCPTGWECVTDAGWCVRRESACVEKIGDSYAAAANGNTCTLSDGGEGICVLGRCVESICGDGYIDESRNEECSDDGCSATCQIEWGWYCVGDPSERDKRCGDGLVALTEECDDGRQDDGDGCSATCTLEGGFGCSGNPSQGWRVVFVNLDPAISVRDGLSWQTAFAKVQAATAAVRDLWRHGISCEIWVAGGDLLCDGSRRQLCRRPPHGGGHRHLRRFRRR
jgi:cysteine-rich repeat protein